MIKKFFRKLFGVHSRMPYVVNKTWMYWGRYLPANKWMHVAVVFDKSGFMKIYIDGLEPNLRDDYAVFNRGLGKEEITTIVNCGKE